ncbi:MAG: Hpt domain-containing protein, partial [Mariprofundaceae bacterium]|nr:Hpt domain-containing protein [Mariprofundaceae bacterium]
ALRTPAMVQFLFDMHDRLAERLQAVDSEPVDSTQLRQTYEALLESGGDVSASDASGDTDKATATEPQQSDEVFEEQEQQAEEESHQAARTVDGVVDKVEEKKDWGDFTQFIEAFFDEARQRLGSINQALVALESDSLDAVGLAALMRDAHTIKGSALMLGVTDVGGAGHIFEDAVERMTGDVEIRTPAMAQLLMDIHDRLAERLQAVDAPSIDVKVFQQRFDALLAEDGSAAPGDESALHAAVASELEAVLQDEAESGEVGTAGTVAQATQSGINAYRPDVSEVKARVGGHVASGRFLRVDAERLNVLSGQLIELSTGKAFGTQLNLDVQSLLKQLGQLQFLARKVKGELPEGAASESLGMFDRQMDWLNRTTKH